MPRSPPSAPVAQIASTIHLVRGQRVMLDADLAALYSVSTKRLNEQVRRNLSRFAEDLAFRLTQDEVGRLRSQIATSKTGRGGRRYLPMAFTEHGAVMPASVMSGPEGVHHCVPPGGESAMRPAPHDLRMEHLITQTVA
jgi:hypothetical protein